MKQRGCIGNKAIQLTLQQFAPCGYQCLALSPRSPLVPPSVLFLLPGVNSGGWCVLTPDHYATSVEERRGEVVRRKEKRGEVVRRKRGERREERRERREGEREGGSEVKREERRKREGRGRERRYT